MAVDSRWNSTVDDAQLPCLTIATSSNRGVGQPLATGVWAGPLPVGHFSCRVINGLCSFSAKVCNTADKPLVSNSSPMLTSFHSFTTICCTIGVPQLGSTLPPDMVPPDGAAVSVTTGKGLTWTPCSPTTTGVWTSIGRPQGCGRVGKDEYLGYLGVGPRLGRRLVREARAGHAPQALERMACVRAEREGLSPQFRSSTNSGAR